MYDLKEYKKIISSIVTLVLVTVMILGTVTEQAFAFSTFSGASPYSGVYYSSYLHNKDKFDGNVILNGVDASEWQSGAKANWTKARSNGVDFAILRVTGSYYAGKYESNTSYAALKKENKDKYLDSDFATHYKKAKAAGMMVGVYVFSQACSVEDAELEAEYAVKRLQALGIGPEDLDMPVYMDYEFSGKSSGSSKGRMYVAKANGNLTKAKATSYAKAFCEKIESYGYEAGIYANLTFLNNTIDGKTLGKSYDIWAAQYYNKNEFEGTYSKWQYSSAAKIDGIYNASGSKTSVDVNYWYVDPDRTSSNANDIANASYSGAVNVQYTGKALTPKYTITMGDKTLVEGTDYRIGYARNTALGTGYAYVKGLGNYTGYKLISFKIQEVVEDANPRNEDGSDVLLENLGIADFVDEEQVPKITLKEDPIAAGYVMDENNLNGIINGSTANALKASVNLAEGYEMSVVTRMGRELTDDMTVITGDILDIKDSEGNRVASLKLVVDGAATIKLSQTSFTYDKKVKKPNVTVSFGDLMVAEKAKGDNDYVTVKYSSGSKLPGKYEVTITGKGCFEGTYTASYSIAVAKTSIKSLSSPSKGNIKVSWNKKTGTCITGYQIQYSRSSDMSNSLTTTKTSYKNTSTTITKRYSGYKYYVRIRTYKTISGKKYYSAWSDKKTVKVI